MMFNLWEMEQNCESLHIQEQKNLQWIDIEVQYEKPIRPENVDLN